MTKMAILYNIPIDYIPDKAYDCCKIIDTNNNLESLENGKIKNLEDCVILNQDKDLITICDINFVDIFETDVKKDYNGFRWIGSHNRYSDGVTMYRYERMK